MHNKFKNKYRIASARLASWDYGWNAAYFVTICTKNRVCFFGDVADDVMQLSEIGEIVEKYWYEIPDHFPYVRLGEFRVMPNHVHGIVIIDKSNGDPDMGYGAIVETPDSGVSTITTTTDTKSYPHHTGGKNKNWKPGVLGVIINQYKRICTIEARKIRTDYAWQSRFHDHIIRDKKSFDNISQYIKNNPENWSDDQFFK